MEYGLMNKVDRLRKQYYEIECALSDGKEIFEAEDRLEELQDAIYALQQEAEYLEESWTYKKV